VLDRDGELQSDVPRRILDQSRDLPLAVLEEL